MKESGKSLDSGIEFGILLLNECPQVWLSGRLSVSLKSTETRDGLSPTCNLKVMSRMLCQHLMLHPYITASRTSSQN